MEVNLFAAVLVFVAYGSSLGDESYNSHCNIAEPYGKRNLFDAVLVLVSYEEKWSSP